MAAMAAVSGRRRHRRSCLLCSCSSIIVSLSHPLALLLLLLALLWVGSLLRGIGGRAIVIVVLACPSLGRAPPPTPPLMRGARAIERRKRKKPARPPSSPSKTLHYQHVVLLRLDVHGCLWSVSGSRDQWAGMRARLKRQCRVGLVFLLVFLRRPRAIGDTRGENDDDGTQRVPRARVCRCGLLGGGGDCLCALGEGVRARFRFWSAEDCLLLTFFGKPKKRTARAPTATAQTHTHTRAQSKSFTHRTSPPKRERQTERRARKRDRRKPTPSRQNYGAARPHPPSVRSPA